MKTGTGIGIMMTAVAGIVFFLWIEQVYAAGIGDRTVWNNEYRYMAEREPVMPAGGKGGSAVYSTPVSAHKVLGYCTLGFGLAAMTTGIIDHVDRDRGRKPSRAQQAVHAIASYGTAALAVSACTSGFVQYGNMFSLDAGMAKYNAHLILGLVSTAGFIGSIVSAKIDRKNQPRSSKGGFAHHTWIAAGSGAAMMFSVVVMYF